jgi:glycosyltransferase involved in cell wall biosynthesis
VKLSVIIPTYKDNERLVKCVECLEKQVRNQSVEILVVDNAGDAALAELLKIYPHTTYLVETKPGSYAARNAGLQVASGDVIAFTDSDCLPEDDWIECALGLIESLKADIVAGRVVVFPLDKYAPNCWEIADMVFGFPVEQRVRDGGGGVTANLVATRACFSTAGPFEEDNLSGGDMEWCRRATGTGLKLCYRNDLVVRHPARRSMSEHLVKAKRVAGALADRSSKARSSVQLLRDIMRLPLPPARDWRKLGANQSLAANAKLRGMWARAVFHYYMKWQILKYLALPSAAKERR